MIRDFISLFENQVFIQALHFIRVSWPVWLPVITFNIAFRVWRDYIQRDWLNKQGSIFLEIKLPKDVPKSPAAMEFVLQGIWENANISTPADAFWEGKMREWFSLEIVSINGEVRFFVWAFPRWKKIIEARVYAQYPGAEVVEVKDYALDLHYDPEKTFVFGVNTALVKPDPYPIKTYIEYELDKKKSDEQEEVIDPITPMIEYLGTFQPHEVACYQIIIRAHADESYLYGHLAKKKDWQGDIKDEIKKMIEEEAFIKPEEGKPASMLNLSKAQTETVAAIQRNAGKLAFDTMIRLFYMAPEDNYDKNRGVGMIGSMRQLGSKDLNGIKPEFFSFTHPWQDFNGIRKRDRLTRFVDSIKRRAYFGPIHYHLFHEPYILTTEELATLFHLPSSVATTPNLKRASSKKSEAPANLPI